MWEKPSGLFSTLILFGKKQAQNVNIVYVKRYLSNYADTDPGNESGLY